MNKIYVSGFVTLAMSTGILLLGSPATTHAEAPKSEVPPSVISDIAVPFEVEMRAQMDYQGHAVTQVHRTTHNNKPAYRLRVDRDDIPTDHESIFLLYDENWKLINSMRDVPPPPPRAQPTRPQPNPAKPDKPREEKEDKKQDPPASPEQPSPVGGRGSGGGDSDADKPDKPEARKPEEPTDEEPSQPQAE